MILPFRLAAVAVAGTRTLPRVAAAPLLLASPPESRRGLPRRPDIQGLRALAVLLVVAYHAGLPVRGGFIGVDVFFVISGFVIARILLAELEATGRIDLPRFYARRIRRLLPAMALMVAVVGAIGMLVMPAGSQRIAAFTGAAASVFGANIYLAGLETSYFDVSTALDPFLHTWSLAVEEQFYVFFPMLLFGAWYLGVRRGAGRGVIAGAVAVVFVASLAASLALAVGQLVADEDFGMRLSFYGSPTRAWEFAVGALVAIAASRAGRLSPSAARILGLAGATAVVVAAVRTESNDLLAVGGACVLLAAGVGRSLGASRALGTRPAVWVGDLSYSLYLWHWPLIVYARALWPGSGWAAPAAAAASFLAAWASYRYVENPIRFNHAIVGRRLVALAGVCVIVPLAASLGLLAVERAVSGTESMRSLQRARTLHADVMRGCDRASPPQQDQPGPCTWAVRNAKGSVVLFGDSNAGHFTEPVVRAANRSGFDATVITYSSCPPVELRVERAVGGAPSCAEFEAQTLHRLTSQRPSLVVLASRTDAYVEDAAVGLAASGFHETTHDADAKAKLWGRSPRSLLARLNGAGVPVLLVHPIPALPPTPERCAVIRILVHHCRSSIERSVADARLRRSIDVERTTAAATPATSVIDFEAELCPNGRCESTRGGVVWYRDSEHLSVEGSLQLTDAFFRAIVAHARQPG